MHRSATVHVGCVDDGLSTTIPEQEDDVPHQDDEDVHSETVA